MSRNGLKQVSTTSCTHNRLILSPSTHAKVCGFQRPSAQQRAAATTSVGQVKGRNEEEKNDEPINPAAFPAPLILPGDDLALDPHYPPHTKRAWLREKSRNKVTQERRTIYVAAPPSVDPDVEFVRSWSKPGFGAVAGEEDILPVNVEDVVRYLEAFYHGLPVTLLPSKLRFAAWDEDPAPPPSKQARKGKGGVSGKGCRANRTHPSLSHIALNTSIESIRIRIRPRLSSPYSHQLNLDDLLDAAIAVLPTDAFALLLLVEQDLFEDEEDEFVCGRAYGGSRVAVVSSARYHPALDAEHGVEREHAWPASHCEEYVKEMCAASGSHFVQKRKPGSRKAMENDKYAILINTSPSSGLDPPLVAALKSLPCFSSSSISPQNLKPLTCSSSSSVSQQTLKPLTCSSSFSISLQALALLHLSRVCKTASHELGHCLGIDHCVYYACIMQGSASLAEDARQPPYLCPVDEAKVAAVTGKEKGERGKVMGKLCAEWGLQEREAEGKGAMFGAFGAWVSAEDRM